MAMVRWGKQTPEEQENCPPEILLGDIIQEDFQVHFFKKADTPAGGAGIAGVKKGKGVFRLSLAP
jgi:hypothetical protein